MLVTVHPDHGNDWDQDPWDIEKRDDQTVWGWVPAEELLHHDDGHIGTDESTPAEADLADPLFAFDEAVQSRCVEWSLQEIRCDLGERSGDRELNAI